MKRSAALIACLALTASLGAADLSPTADSTSVAVAAPAAPKADGFTYEIGATALSVFNGSPLSYTPFELGWRFASGLRLRGGVDLFYYEGMDTDAKLPEQGTQLYSYEMMDLRMTALYAVPLPSRVRPLAGLTAEFVRGTRKLAGNIDSPPTQDAWGFIGSGAALGAEWRVTDGLALELLARYTFSFGNYGALTGVGLDTAFLF